MKFTVVAVGKLKERFWTEACAEYAKRLQPYARTKVVEVPDIAGGRRSGAATGAGTPEDRHKEIRDAIERLLALNGSFPASQLSREVTSVGERTIRRHLAKMVSDGELRVVSGGRSTRYASAENNEI